jgi:uncharacterized RDD family membrane protein YckC
MQQVRESVRRETGELSTSLSQPYAESPWKQEVNQRLAAHRSRKGQSEIGPQRPTEVRQNASSLAAQAAARVAARYAKAPSFSEMQAEEAHAALHAAEVATRAALEAQAVASVAIDGLRAAHLRDAEAAQPAPSPSVQRPPASEWTPAHELPQRTPPTRPQAHASQPLEVRWEQDLPMRSSQPPQARAMRQEEPSAIAVEEGWEDASPAMEPWDEESFETVEPALPIHANLLEFPRELVATRKVRPRLAEGPLAAQPDRQLSIFEVDPGTISVEPEPAAFQKAASAWSVPEWPRLELEEQILPDTEPQEVSAPVLDMASFGRRLLAVVVDGLLITGAFLGAAMTAFTHMAQLPSPKILELGAIVGFVLIGMFYQLLFSTLANGTPGMKYARVSLCTFNNQSLTRLRMQGRLGAMLLSVLPAGLGLAWALFDENHLCWHDRLSQTYLRKY